MLKFKSHPVVCFKLSKHKFFECEFGRHKYWDWFRFDVSWTRTQDHAGLHFDFELCGWFCFFAVYDHRHWDYDEDDWHTPYGEFK
jgi:hypothetical protein